MGASFTMELEGAERAVPTTEQLLGGPSQRFANEMLFVGLNHLNTTIPVDRGTARDLAQPGAGVTGVDPSPIPRWVRWGTRAHRKGHSYPGSLNKGATRGPGGMTPVANLERWIRRQGIKPKRRGKQSQAKAIRSMAFAIARSHAKHGQQNAPRYVAGPHAGEPTKGWFDSLRTHMDAEMPRLLKSLRADIVKEWNRVRS